MSIRIAWVLLATLLAQPLLQAAEPAPAHAEHSDPDRDGPAEVHLTTAQRRAVGVAVEVLAPRRLGDEIRAPGEVELNAYATAQVTPRIPAQVLRRHARLGDQVQAGQPLVTLSSVEMAQAQGDLVVADSEWQRVRKLGKQALSERRFTQAQVARQQARARVQAFGMTPEQVDRLSQLGATLADGTFQLPAPRAGTVIRDQFILGERVEPGRVLFEITDERVLWVEAWVTPEEAGRIRPGDRARVRHANAWLEGQVTQVFHALDHATRTQAVRIEVPNKDHRLHPGLFVDVRILTGAGLEVLALPEEAVLRSPDGDWLVFVSEGDGEYRPVEVDILRTTGGLAVISGLTAGTPVVTQGAFFLQSELAKGGFEVHQH